jgi:hypothetical protein
MKAKAKKAKAKKVVKTNGKLTRAEVMNAAKSKDRTAGEFIRARILEGKLETSAIADACRKAFKGSKATSSDVYWNRNYLKQHGISLS